MKIFTHILVLYDNGFCWRWEEKEKQTPFGLIKLILSIAIIGFFISHSK